MVNSGPDPWTYLRSLPPDEPPDDLLFRIFAERRRRQHRQRWLRGSAVAASLLLVVGLVSFLALPSWSPQPAGVDDVGWVEGSRSGGAPSHSATAVEQAIADAHRHGATPAEIARLQKVHREVATAVEGHDRPFLTLM